MPLRPNFAATSSGTGIMVPPPPRGVGVKVPLNLTTTPHSRSGGARRLLHSAGMAQATKLKHKTNGREGRTRAS